MNDSGSAVVLLGRKMLNVEIEDIILLVLTSRT